MFEHPTVFILGAGASWHYGYPTGEDLVKKIIKIATNRPEQIFDKDKYSKIAESLKTVDPLVIDYFLSQNKDLQDIGKKLISWVILELESYYLLNNHNKNRIELLENSPDRETRDKARRENASAHKDNWCRFIIHQLLNGVNKSEDLIKNNVIFITFNYDTSLEYKLYKGLGKIQSLDEKSINEFLEEDRIIHIYGSVHKEHNKIRVNVAETSEKWGKKVESFKAIHTSQNSNTLFDEIDKASQNIRTIGGENGDKKDNIETLNRAKNAIKNAEVVYILGYGFDEQNSNLLGLHEFLRSQYKKKVMFTNYGNLNRINKKAAKLFGIDANIFSKNENVIFGHIQPNDYYYEKSINNVYDAFAYDFDTIENYKLN